MVGAITRQIGGLLLESRFCPGEGEIASDRGLDPDLDRFEDHLKEHDGTDQRAFTRVQTGRLRLWVALRPTRNERSPVLSLWWICLNDRLQLDLGLYAFDAVVRDAR